MPPPSLRQWRYAFSTPLFSILIYLLLYNTLLTGFRGVFASNTTTVAVQNSTSTIASSTPGTNATKTIGFSSAVQIASSVQFELQQLASIPAIPLPTNVTNITGYAGVSRLAAAMPPLQAGVEFPDAEDMIADLISWTNISVTGNTLAGREAAIRVMIVGDSMSQGQQGDWTWRYRIWQWFQDNAVTVEFVGPYTGTVPPLPASPPVPPPLYAATPSSTPVGTTGGYATGVDSAFLSNSNHFAVWGRAAAVDKGFIQNVVEQNEADLMLLMLGFNDMGWFYSDAPGTIDNIGTLITSARAANPNMIFAVANVPQRSFIGGREDLVENTDIYNNLLPTSISQWTTEQSPVYLVELEQNYDCQPGGCPAGE